MPLASVVGLECLVVRIDPAAGAAIDAVPQSARDVRGKAVLFHTSWDRHWRTDASFEEHPHLTERAAEWRVKAGAVKVKGCGTFSVRAYVSVAR